MAFASNSLGTYLAHSTLRLLNRDLKSICITNVTTNITSNLNSYNDIEFNSVNCSSHSQQVFSALLALQKTRELLPSPIQITGISTGSTMQIVRNAPSPTGDAALPATAHTESVSPTDAPSISTVNYLQADWTSFPVNDTQTAHQTCAHATFIEKGNCSNTLELARFRITRDLYPSTSIIGTQHYPALSLKPLENEDLEPAITVLTICPNEANPLSTPRH